MLATSEGLKNTFIMVSNSSKIDENGFLCGDVKAAFTKRMVHELIVSYLMPNGCLTAFKLSHNFIFLYNSPTFLCTD